MGNTEGVGRVVWTSFGFRHGAGTCDQIPPTPLLLHFSEKESRKIISLFFTLGLTSVSLETTLKVWEGWGLWWCLTLFK